MVPLVNDLPPVVVTRPLAQAQSFAKGLDPRLRAVIAPVQRIVAVPVDAPQLAYETILLTSSNAVRALAALDLPRGQRIFAVGDRTAEQARALGCEVVSASGTVEDVLALCLSRPEAAPFWHLRGEHSRGDLVPRLCAKGIKAHETVCYHQVAQELGADVVSLIEGEGAVLLPLFSPRSAALVLDQATPGPMCICIAISERVAERAYAKGVANVVVAKAPDQLAMWAALQQCLGLRDG